MLALKIFPDSILAYLRTLCYSYKVRTFVVFTKYTVHAVGYSVRYAIHSIVQYT